MPALWTPRPGAGRMFPACSVPSGVGTPCYSSLGSGAPGTPCSRGQGVCVPGSGQWTMCAPAPRPSGSAGPCRGQPHSAGHPAQQTLRWPKITGTHGRVQPAHLPRGPANGPGDPDSPPFSLSREDSGKSSGRSSGPGDCSAREIKGCATLGAFDPSHLPHHGPNEKQEELQLAGKADAPRGWRGRAFSQIDLHALPPWGPSCPTEAPQRAFPSNREQAEVLGCVWGSLLMVQTGGHVRIRPCTGNGTDAMVLVPTVSGGLGCDSHKDPAHPTPTSRCENTQLGDSRAARGPLPRDAASLHAASTRTSSLMLLAPRAPGPACV